MPSKMLKIQATYRAGVQTGDAIVDAINQGIEKMGSFSKYVNSLIEAQLSQENCQSENNLNEIGRNPQHANEESSAAVIGPDCNQNQKPATPIYEELTQINEKIENLTKKLEAVPTLDELKASSEKNRTDIITEVVTAKNAIIQTSQQNLPDISAISSSTDAKLAIIQEDIKDNLETVNGIDMKLDSIADAMNSLETISHSARTAQDDNIADADMIVDNHAITSQISDEEQVSDSDEEDEKTTYHPKHAKAGQEIIFDEDDAIDENKEDSEEDILNIATVGATINIENNVEQDNDDIEERKISETVVMQNATVTLDTSDETPDGNSVEREDIDDDALAGLAALFG